MDDITPGPLANRLFAVSPTYVQDAALVMARAVPTMETRDALNLAEQLLDTSAQVLTPIGAIAHAVQHCPAEGLPDLLAELKTHVTAVGKAEKAAAAPSEPPATEEQTTDAPV